MRRAAFTGLAFLLLAISAATPAVAQTPAESVPQLTREQIMAHAKAYVAVSAAREAVHLELAQARNKTPDAQKQLQEKLRTQIAQILKDHGLSDEDYRRSTYVISSDPAQRRTFDEIVAELTKKT